MYGELAKYRIDDLVREADAYRMTKSTRLAREPSVGRSCVASEARCPGS